MGFSSLDCVVVVVYLACILGMGLHFMRQKEGADDYFVGGRRFHWLPVAISMFASLFSAISYIATPAEAYNHGMMLFLFSAAVILGIPPAVIVFVRFFRRLSLTTAYEYLERRFDLKVRLTASLLFLLLRSSYLGVVLFASGVALQPAIGWPVWLSVVVVGALATVCATVGGIKAVIWIEVVQFVVLLGGILLVLAILISRHPEGMRGIWSYAQARNHTFDQVWDKSFYSLDPYQRITLWIVVVSAVFTKLGCAGADQISIQRYLSTRSEEDASRSLVWGTVLAIPVMFLLFLTGLGLFYYYEVHPERSLPGMTGDQALTCFISNELPPGIGGIIMAGILAAVINTMCSVLNSLSTCTITDFYGRMIRQDASDHRKLRAARFATLVWGLLSILCAGLIMWLFGTEGRRNPLMDVTYVTINLFTGILLGVFLLGVLSRRANGNGALVGAVAGLAAALTITAAYYFRELPEDAPKLSFLWINIIGCLVTIGVGYGVSLLGLAPDPAKLDGLTYWDSKEPDTESTHRERTYAQEPNQSQVAT